MKIMVAVDLSESMETVIRKADELARALSAKVWVVHITEPEPDFIGFDPGPTCVRKSMSEEFHHEHNQLQAISEKLREADIDASALLIQGPTVEKLLKQASSLEVDMIIIGSHRRGSIYQFLVGSVGAGLLHDTNCPVLVVPTSSAV